jgi:hypothetical protein
MSTLIHKTQALQPEIISPTSGANPPRARRASGKASRFFKQGMLKLFTNPFAGGADSRRSRVDASFVAPAPRPSSKVTSGYSSYLNRFAMLAVICGLGASNVLGASTTVVISQIYGGGGNTSATYKNDFIELHNLSASSVSVNGWSVQYASAANNSWSVTALPNVSIPAGGYFLIQEGPVGSVGSALPTPDVTGSTSINMAAGSGKVALRNTTTALTSATPLPDSSIIDFIGYGTTASAYEGSSFAPGPSDNVKSAQRKNNGMQDTDNNSSDFTATSTAAARNSATTVYGPPGLTTQAASSLSTSGATLNGTITAANGSTLTDRGFYYSASPTVTTSGTQASEGGTSLGTYLKAISGLSVNTIYYYRAYAVNGAGTTLDSADTSFYTLAAVPSAPTVNNPTTSSLDVTIGANGNPATTTYAIATGGQFVQVNGTLGGTAVYQNLATWGSTITVKGLNSGTMYSFTVQAKNGAGIITSASPSASNSTTSAVIYTVTYDGNGNTGGSAPNDPNSPYPSGATVTVLGNTGGLVKTGSNFAGWNTAQNGLGTTYGATFVIGANTTLYALWTSSPTISGAATAAAFTTTYGTASAVQTFAVSGVNLTTDLIATAPTGFEVSSDGTAYSGTATFHQTGGSASGTLSVRLKATAPVSGSYNSQSITLTSTGASTVSINTAASGNIITPKALTIGSPTIASKPYDATTTAGAVTVGTLSGFVGSETVTATATAAAYSSANAGSYSGDVVIYTLHDGTGGGLAANYSLANGAATGVITPVALSITAPSIADKTYNGNTTAGTVTVGTLSGFVGSETVTATGLAAAYSSANVGTYPGNVITYTLVNGTGGGLAINYTLANGTASGNITAKTLTITANSVSKTVGTTLTGGASSTAFTSSGLVSGETIGSVTITYGSGAAAGDAVGTYPLQVTPSAATGGTFTAANYNITYASGAITVLPPLVAGWDFQTTSGGGTAAAVAPSSPLVYTANLGTGTIYLDGTSGSSTWTSLSSNPQVTAFAGTAVNADAAIGFSTVTTSPACLGLANSSANGQKIVFKFSMANQVGLVVSYATQATATGFNSQLWEYSTDGNNWTTAQTVSSIPTSFATITLSTITGMNGASTAYLRLTVSGATSASGNNRLDNIQIRASAATVVTLSGSKIYDGTTTVPAASLTVVNNTDGGNLTLSGSVTLASANGGLETISDFSGLTLGGSAAGNYTLTGASGSVRINPGPGTISMSTTTNTAANLATNKLVLIASDAGVTLSVTGVSSPSMNGGTVALNGANITYTPATGYIGADSFTYTLSDNVGGSSIGTVNVMVNTVNASASFSGSGISVVPGVSATLTGSGIPLQTYNIQAASSLSGPWATIGTAKAFANGVISYTDTTFAATNSSPNGYYRLAQ